MTLQGLDGFEQQEHRSIVDGQGFGGVRPPARAGFTSFEEGVSVGIEERAAEGGEGECRVFDAPVDGSEQRQQPGPGRMASFEDLLRLGT